MKKAIVILIAALFLVSIVGVCFAQDAMTNAPAAEKTKMKHHMAKAKGKVVVGEVTAVSDTSISIKPARGEEVKLTVTDKTKKPAELKQGDKVRAYYTVSDMTAKSIKAVKAKAKPKAKAKAKTTEEAPAAPAGK
jgi:ribosomal protein S1